MVGICMVLNYLNFYTVLILIGVLSFIVFILWRKFGYIEENYEFAEDGLRILYWTRPFKIKVPYHNIDSIELLPISKFFFSRLHLQCMASGLWRINRAPGNVVIIKKKRGIIFGYIIVTPKDPVAFVKRLQNRVHQSA
jgi:hypothetical protein